MNKKSQDRNAYVSRFSRAASRDLDSTVPESDLDEPSSRAPDQVQNIRPPSIPTSLGVTMLDFLRNNWLPAIVISVLGWLGSIVYAQNRELGKHDVALESIEKQVEKYEEKNAELENIRNQDKEESIKFQAETKKDLEFIRETIGRK